MAKTVQIHPLDPQPRLVQQVADVIGDGGLVAYPTDSGYALGCALGNAEGIARIKSIRRLDDRHHFTAVCADFAQLGQFVVVSNSAFRLVNSMTPGAYTFILPATKEIPRRMQHPKKKTVGVRIPAHRFVLALLDQVGEPLLSTTLILPGEQEALNNADDVSERIGHALDLVVECGEVSTEPTSVIDLSGDAPEVIRVGGGDVSRFE
ncbi:MAG: threonylcarbamoyl-AMP synthase [Micrococcales bacterium]|nr:MAG: threonylcarbamoyl-AMP synthase [Micrococcales bacterium]PIE27357.1 MAG: threonylcarbamoyl-AMP synthase [Micrococcales bacterium]